MKGRSGETQYPDSEEDPVGEKGTHRVVITDKRPFGAFCIHYTKNPLATDSSLQCPKHSHIHDLM